MPMRVSVFREVSTYLEMKKKMREVLMDSSELNRKVDLVAKRGSEVVYTMLNIRGIWCDNLILP